MALPAFFAHVRDDMVALVAGKSLEEAELRDWLKTWLAHFKLPHEIVFLDELPPLCSSNVDRAAQMGAAGYPA
jgi:acyl-CoA synthetase (AMP-forming)/AMP-acid ligase II